MLCIVNDILDLHQLNKGKLVMNLEEFSLGVVLEETIDLFEIQAQNKGIKISYEVEPDTPDWLRTDKNRLQQILVNLLSNALKFTMRGSIELKVSKGETEDEL